MQIDDQSRLVLIKKALAEIADSDDPRAADARAELMRQLDVVGKRLAQPTNQVVTLRPLAMNSKIRGV